MYQRAAASSWAFQNAAVQIKINQLKEENQALTEQGKALTRENKQLAFQVNDMQKRLATTEKRAQRAEDKLKHELADLKHTHREVTCENERLHAEITGLRERYIA